MTAAQQGHLLIADISGYTAFLGGSELEHAQQILQSLLELLIEQTRPPLAISRTAGDAVISYALSGVSIQGQTFIEMIEDTYVAFRRAIDRIVMNTTCKCNACANVQSLDLKFFVHHGTFVVQKLAGRDELVGNDVNLIHRLTKNHVVERTGIPAYALYTDAVLQQLGLDGFREGLVAHAETYEHLGETQVWIQDMRPVWLARKDAIDIDIPADQVGVRSVSEIALPPHRVWDYLVDPAYRGILANSTRQGIRDRKQGRVQEGSAFECYHGDRLTLQTVVRWRPFERISTEDRATFAGAQFVVPVDYRLEPIPSGTRLTQTMAQPRGSAAVRLLIRLFLPLLRKHAQRDLDRFKAHIERHAAEAVPAS